MIRRRKDAPSGSDGRASRLPPLAPPKSDGPVNLSLRDIAEPAPPPQQAQAPADDRGLVVSDSDARVWAGGEEIDLQARPDMTDPRAARRAQVRRDRLQHAAEMSAAEQRAADERAARHRAAELRAAEERAAQARAAEERAAAEAQALALREAQARAEAAARAKAAESPPAPEVLVLGSHGAAIQAVYRQLVGFGFRVRSLDAPPQMPAPWPFAAVFVDRELTMADGGDAIDLCNQVRETSRLPGERKPVLMLVAGQLSATDRVRAGLAGCNELIVGEITRGAVAGALDRRGVVLPSDARRA